MRVIYENLRTVTYAAIIAIVLRTFLFQPFSIPSGSMIPTLLVGDFLFVSKYSYGYSEYSFPFTPLPFSGRVFAAPPQRGDVVVFKLPADNRTDFIKRVIGLPGDRIQVIDGVVHINGAAVPRERIDDFIAQDSYGITRRIARYRETLENGVSYEVLDRAMLRNADNTPIYEVPEDAYFMMGDNRDDSTDSRFTKVGMVPGDNLIGRAEILFFSYDNDVPSDSSWLGSLLSGNLVRWTRIGDTL